MYVCIYSLTIPGADEDILKNYSHLLPPMPRIVDPVNPANNLFKTGVRPIKRHHQNKWDIFAAKIDSLVLEPTETHILSKKFEFCQTLVTKFD